jgi:uncharacterized protein (PEP-CTERM system associated)
VEERFDDNIFSTQDAPESDFVTAIMPAIAASRQATRVESEARYRLRFERFAQHPEFNQTSPDHDLDARLVLHWGRDAEIEASEHLSYTPEQPEFLGENRVGNVLGEGIRTGRSTSFRNVAAIRLRQPVGGRIALGGRYQYGVSRYDNVALIDSTRHEVVAGLSYELTPGSAFAEYGYHGVVYEANENARFHTLKAGYIHRISPVAALELSAGASFPRQAGGSDPQFVGEVGIRRVLSRWGWRLLYARQMGSSGGFLPELSISQRVSVNVTRRIARDFTASVSGNYATNRSITSTAQPWAIEAYGVRLDAVYAVSTWMLLSAGYSHFQQDPDGPLGSRITRNQVLISLTAARRDINQE